MQLLLADLESYAAFSWLALDRNQKYHCQSRVTVKHSVNTRPQKSKELNSFHSHCTDKCGGGKKRKRSLKASMSDAV